MITIHVQVREVLLMWCQSRCTKFFNELEVGYVGFVINTCAGGVIPVFRLQGYVVEQLFTVTTLLIDRSLVTRV
jgi:hypothetical protein